MKVLFFFPRLNKYPKFKPLINICQYLALRGCEVYIAINNPPTEQQVNNFAGSASFVIMDNEISKAKNAYNLLNESYDFYIGVQAHNVYWLSIIKSIFKMKFNKKVLISWEHSSPITSLKNERYYTYPFWLTIRKLLSLKTDAFFCVSRKARLEIIDGLKLNNNKVYYIPNYIFDKDNHQENKVSESCRSSVKILSVGRMSSEKGFEFVLDALEENKALLNFNYTYHLVGDGPELSKLKEKVNASDYLSSKVTFYGRRNDINEIMRSSDILLLSSYFEGLPTVLVEACLNNLPIVSSNCQTGPSEIVSHGVNGYLFDVGDKKGLINAIALWNENRDKINNDFKYALDFSELAGSKFYSTLSTLKGRQF